MTVAMYTLLVGLALMPLELPVALQKCWYDRLSVLWLCYGSCPVCVRHVCGRHVCIRELCEPL